MSEATENQIVEMGKRFYALKTEKDQLEERVSEINKILHELAEKQIPEAMQAAEIEKVSIAEVGTLSCPTKFYGYVRAEVREEFFAYLRSTDNGALIKEAVHPGSLNSFVKEMYESGVELPEFIQVRTVPTAKITKARSKQ